MNYHDLINVDDFQKRESFNLERGEISFFCKDCNEIVETQRKQENAYIFICQKCQGQNVAIGTLAGLKENYKIK